MTSSRHLETFLTVLRTGSITSAARQLDLSPSAVSQQISTLERDLGVDLFIRHARRLEPAPAAAVAADHARTVLAQLDALKHRLQRPPEEPALVVGMFASLAQRLARPLQARLDSAGISARYIIGDPPAVARPLLGPGGYDAGVDLALIFHLGDGSPAVTADVAREWIEDEPFDVVLPTAWGTPGDADRETLGQLPWIVHHPGTADAAIMERSLALNAEGPDIAARSDDFRASLELVRAGVGAALIPRWVHRSESAEGLDVRPGTGIRLSRRVFALSRRSSPVAPLVPAVLAAIRAELRRPPAPGMPRSSRTRP
ncbi:LysR family transcriptional regulator [Falsarthrobacter nasiphocae]|uniref:DNA-binding transcriptional LysR family regulator n=1 Tax=Falsarthrobacter nasiphocae TaxID=189863 RepID=A0AAE4C674_9MICC|nr:LysR family transcriptional regulator [Falsarthrobacter nasiphocae]MDR6891204.1 DNA-binding transcriptional LysR family regulator [Falsarthrobacter nasiphocae]